MPKPVASRVPASPAAEASALYEAMQALVRVYQFRDRDRGCYGEVTPNECYALEALEASGGATVSALAAALALHKSNASRVVTALVRKGFAARRQDGNDARAVRVAITARGVAVHAAIRRSIERRYVELLRELPRSTRRDLVGLVRALGAEAAERIGRHRSRERRATGS